MERIQYHRELWIPKHGHIHRPLEFTFDPGDFICGPPKVIPRDVDYVLD